MNEFFAKTVEWVTTNPTAAMGMIHALTLMLLAAAPVAAVVVAGYAIHALKAGRHKGKMK